MAQREAKGSAGSFARGAELWMHQARLVTVAIGSLMVISLAISVAIGTAYFWRTSSENDRYALERNVLAHVRDVLAMTAGKMELSVNGQVVKMEVKDVARLTEEPAADAMIYVHNGLIVTGLSFVGLAFLIGLFWWGYGRSKMTDVQLRGARLVEGKDLAKLIRSRGEASPYSIAGVPMRARSETLHTLMSGAQGTGKSQQFFALMKQIRARGKRMIVYDPTGEFTQAFYREGIDILMNPLDARSPNWNIWNEIGKDYHFDNLANGLIPDPAEADPFWAQAGRMVLKDVYRVLGREGRRTNRDLYNSIAKSNLEAMYALLQGTAGQTYVDPMTERTGMSLKMTVQNQLEAFRFLHDEGEPFSIRKWVHEEEVDSWMFITARESMREALKPVLSLWIDTAIKAVLDLEPIHQERLWFSLDELPTLQKMDILKLALTNTRKYGLCMVLGVQDFSQLYEIYGHDLAKTIISGCQTKLLLRVTDGAAAKLLSDLMGQGEIDEKEETLSYGLSAQRDGVSVFSRRQMRDIVLTSEILTLPDMTGYLIVPGDYPIAKVSYGYVPTPKIAEGFVERDGFGIDFAPKPAATAGVPKDDLLAADDGPPGGAPGRGMPAAEVDSATGEILSTGVAAKARNPLADAL